MSSTKLLYVEDSPALARLLSEALSLEGIETVLAGDGQGALDALEQHADDVDLVLCDYSLPDMSGLDLMGAIRARYPTLKLVLTSGLIGSGVESKAQAFDGVLAKPFVAKDVVALVERIG